MVAGKALADVNSRWILLRMRNVSDRVVEKIRRHILRSTYFSANVFVTRYCGKIL